MVTVLFAKGGLLHHVTVEHGLNCNDAVYGVLDQHGISEKDAVFIFGECFDVKHLMRPQNDSEELIENELEPLPSKPPVITPKRQQMNLFQQASKHKDNQRIVDPKNLPEF